MKKPSHTDEDFHMVVGAFLALIMIHFGCDLKEAKRHFAVLMAGAETAVETHERGIQ